MTQAVKIGLIWSVPDRRASRRRARYRRAPVTGGSRSSDLLALAKRCRAIR